MSYQQQLEKNFTESESSLGEKLNNFPLYVPNNALSKLLVRYELYKLIKNVPGAIVECGVAGGVGISTFQHLTTIMEPYNDVRTLVGFDTFSGFPAVTEEDTKTGSVETVVGNYCYHSKKEINKASEALASFHPVKPKKIELVEGDICETIPAYCHEHPELVVALLYMDCDLYEPTKVALTHLIPLMPKGAIIVFDELNHPDWPGETQAVNEVLGLKNIRLKRFDTNKICYVVI